MEKNVYETLRRKLPKMIAAERTKATGRGDVIVSTQSATSLPQVPDESVDYVYVDPPFGANIIYSEVNLALESWLGVLTDVEPEAVIDETREKTLDRYRDLMMSAFRECFRALKPGRWMTVEFHNTAADIWNVIQSSIVDSGFIVSAVSTLDKGTTTILGDIRPNSAKHDLLISAYKPMTVKAISGRIHQPSLPELRGDIEELLRAVPTDRPNEIQHHLFSRVVAQLLERGQSVSFSTREFYEFVEPLIAAHREAPAVGGGGPEFEEGRLF
jgi:hypothetical protein